MQKMVSTVAKDRFWIIPALRSVTRALANYFVVRERSSTEQSRLHVVRRERFVSWRTAFGIVRLANKNGGHEINRRNNRFNLRFC